MMSHSLNNQEPSAVQPDPKEEGRQAVGSIKWLGAATHHVCCVCGYRWQSPDAKTEREVLKAVKVNRAGPYCDICMYLEMARRHAEHRGYVFADFVADWVTMKPRSKS